MLIVSIDGGCPGVKNVEAGVIGATSQQYPLKMAAMALEAIASSRKTAEPNDPGLELPRHRRHAHHRQAGRRRSVDLDRGRPEALLGLIPKPRETV